MKIQKFYESYWQREKGSPADHDPTTPERKQKLLKIFEQIPKGSLILDAGCGNGEFSSFIAHQVYQSVSIDIAEAAVRCAMQTYPLGYFHVTSLEHGIPFADNTFAAVWSSEVLEHLFDIHAVLSELNRVLQLESLLVLTVPYHGFVKNLLITIKGFENHYNPYISHIRFFTRKSLTMCLEHTGFQVEKFTGVGRIYPLWKSCFVVARKVSVPQKPPEIQG